MAKLVYGLNQSLDGYVDHLKFSPSLPLFRHFIEHVRGLTGIVYGRRIYEVMRYWDADLPDWAAHEHEFAAAWRSQPKWVVSRSLKSAGPDLAGSLTDLGLIDEYRLYLHPVVLGGGTPYFAGPRPPLRFVASDLITEDVIRLTYVPA